MLQCSKTAFFNHPRCHPLKHDSGGGATTPDAVRKPFSSF
jgi:hypothetical protein